MTSSLAEEPVVVSAVVGSVEGLCEADEAGVEEACCDVDIPCEVAILCAEETFCDVDEACVVAT